MQRTTQSSFRTFAMLSPRRLHLNLWSLWYAQIADMVHGGGNAGHAGHASAQRRKRLKSVTPPTRLGTRMMSCGSTRTWMTRLAYSKPTYPNCTFSSSSPPSPLCTHSLCSALSLMHVQLARSRGPQFASSLQVGQRGRARSCSISDAPLAVGVGKPYVPRGKEGEDIWTWARKYEAGRRRRG